MKTIMPLRNPRVLSHSCAPARMSHARPNSAPCDEKRNALRCIALRGVPNVVEAAERMKAMRERRRARGLRELRLIVPDARSKAVRRRVAREVAALDRSRGLEALNRVEAGAGCCGPRG